MFHPLKRKINFDALSSHFNASYFSISVSKIRAFKKPSAISVNDPDEDSSSGTQNLEMLIHSNNVETYV